MVTCFLGDTRFKSIAFFKEDVANFFLLFKGNCRRRLAFFKVLILTNHEDEVKLNWRVLLCLLFYFIFFLLGIRTLIHIERVHSICRNVFHRLPAVEFGGHVHRTRCGRRSRAAHVLSRSKKWKIASHDPELDKFSIKIMQRIKYQLPDI